jgi:hypothetical protein
MGRWRGRRCRPGHGGPRLTSDADGDRGVIQRIGGGAPRHAGDRRDCRRRGDHGRAWAGLRAQAREEATRARAAAGVLGQAVGDDVAQAAGQRPEAGRLGRDAGDDGGNGRCLERVVPGRREREDRAQGEDIAFRRQLMGVQLLRGHVAKRADDDVGRGQRGGVRALGDAEVDDARPVVGQDNVAGLEVAVDEPAGVDRRQAFRERRP